MFYLNIDSVIISNSIFSELHVKTSFLFYFRTYLVRLDMKNGCSCCHVVDLVPHSLVRRLIVEDHRMFLFYLDYHLHMSQNK